MEKYRVLVPDDLPQSSIQVLKDAELEVVFDPSMSPDRLAREIEDCHGLIVRSRIKVTADLIERARNLRAIVRSGVGVDNIDVAAASKKGIAVMNVPGANAISVAELVFAMILALYRKIVPATESMRAGRWEKKRFKGNEIYEKTLGIIGYGRIGREVVKRAIAFGMKVLISDPYIEKLEDEHPDVRLTTLQELLTCSDILSLHTPLDETTRGLIGAEELARCKPNAILINCARGGVVDEAALFEALKSGKIAGAGLDVFEREPPGDLPLLQLPNVVATPHIGASTVEAQDRTARLAAQQIVAFLLENKPRNVVNAAALVQ